MVRTATQLSIWSLVNKDSVLCVCIYHDTFCELSALLLCSSYAMWIPLCCINSFLCSDNVHSSTPRGGKRTPCSKQAPPTNTCSKTGARNRSSGPLPSRRSRPGALSMPQQTACKKKMRSSSEEVRGGEEEEEEEKDGRAERRCGPFRGGLCC